MTIEIVNEKPSAVTLQSVRERHPVDVWIEADGSVHGICRNVDPDLCVRLITVVGELKGHSFRVRPDEREAESESGPWP